MSEPNPEAVRAAMSEVVETQMRDGDPPETKETYDRLIADGHDHDVGCDKRADWPISVCRREDPSSLIPVW